MVEYQDQEGDLQQVLADRDYAVTFTTHGSEDDVEAASLAGVVLAKIADGVFFDPQSDDWAVGHGAFKLLEDQASESRERLMEVAIKKGVGSPKDGVPNATRPAQSFAQNVTSATTKWGEYKSSPRSCFGDLLALAIPGHLATLDPL